MGDTSVMARRLADGHVQYGWSGNGGYFRVVGLRLLVWYKAPEDVEYLFRLGQTSFIGKKGSEKGGFGWMETHSLTGEPCWLDQTERMIFSKMAFADYGYFYDTDQKWYYIIPGPFRIKMPLELVYNNLDEDDFEFDFLEEIQDKVLTYILTEYIENHPKFAEVLKKEGYTPEEIMKTIREKESGLLNMYRFFEKYRKNKMIDINHQLQYRPINGQQTLYCIDLRKGEARTKTASGRRVIPMTPNVYEMFCEQRKIWLSMKKDPDFEVDGYKNFIFLSKTTGRSLYPVNIRKTLQRIVNMNDTREI